MSRGFTKTVQCGILLAAAGLLLACGRDAAKPPARQPFDVVEASIAGIQRAITEGRTSCHEVVAAYLARIAAYDRPTGLNAITVVNPQALAVADQIDARIKAGGKLGPLFCAPLLVKDNFNTRGLPTTGGSITLKDNVPATDAFQVARVRAADAIVLAKTNMSEWAFSPRRTESSSFGITRNAYALDRVPAGSSGGTASGVAASFGVAGLGSDTGNSIRGPSSHLALFGIRSTIGLTSRDGIIPLAFDRDIGGPMARNVEDAARIFSVIAGYDPADPFTAEARARPPVDYTRFLDNNGLQGARIGVLRALVTTDDADPEVTNLFARALRNLRARGAEIVDPVDVAGFEEHAKDPGFCPRFRYDMYVYLKSLGGHAPFLDVMEAYRSGRYSPYAKDAFEFFAKGSLDVPPEKWKPPCPPYLQHPSRKAYLDAVTAAMDAAKVDVLVYPTWTNPPAHLDRADEEYQGDNSQLVAPATGMPAATVPMGFSHGTLPAGLQILARRFDEGKIFKIAYAYEQATHRRQPPPGFPPLDAAAQAAAFASDAVATVLQRQTQELLDAVTAGSATVWERYLDPQATITAEDGRVMSKSQLVGQIKPLPAGVSGILRVMEFRANLQGPVAVATHVDDEHESYHGHLLHCQYRATDTWLKTPDGWRLIGSQILALRTDPPAVQLSAQQLAAYVGRYTLTPEITYEIRRKDDQLEGQQTGRRAEPLRAEAADVLFVPGKPRYRKVFHRDANGRVTGFAERREAWDLDWTRRP